MREEENVQMSYKVKSSVSESSVYSSNINT